MMEAVARRKAHWLFGSGSDGTFNGKKRPQEDMVTSAVFGSIRLMSAVDRSHAIEMLLGADCFKKAGFEIGCEIEIALWPSLRGAEGRKRVEPDVLLTCMGKTVIVEVKWHAPLSERQLEHQIEAARLADRNVTAVVMLGEAGVDDILSDILCFRRTWREVSGAAQARLRERMAYQTFNTWLRTIHEFLHQTDMGRIFNGLQRIQHDHRSVNYRFVKSGHRPWLHPTPKLVLPANYQFGANK